MNTPRDRRILRAETIAAVTACFYEDSARYVKFYERYRDELGGFPGIWTLCGVAGLAFSKAEGLLRPEWDGEYIGALDNFVTAIYDEGPHLSDETLLDMAKQAIRGATLVAK